MRVDARVQANLALLPAEELRESENSLRSKASEKARTVLQLWMLLSEATWVTRERRKRRKSKTKRLAMKAARRRRCAESLPHSFDYS